MKIFRNVLKCGAVLLAAFVSTQVAAQFVLEPIIVTAPHLQNIDLGPISANGGLDDRGAIQRERTCKYYKQGYKNYDCLNVALNPPPNMEALNIGDQFPLASLVWGHPSLIIFATALFNSGNDSNVRSQALRTAYAASIGKCDKDAPCLREVARFFGVTTVPISDGTGTANAIADVINQLLQATPYGNSPTTSAAGGLMKRYGNHSICEEIQKVLDQNGCP
jgi:hypothetical protein